MPFVENHGVRSYYEVAGSGRPLVLLHGGACDGTAWREAGYVKALEHDFRLILIDQRGAGRSDKPHTPEAYLMEQCVRDVLLVLADLGVSSFTVWGWSFGGNPAIELARQWPDRVEVAVLTGNVPGPSSDEFVRWNHEHLVVPVRARGMAAIVDLAQELEGGRAIPEWTRRQILETDAEAFVATAIGHSRYTGISEADLALMSVPTLLIVGELEDDPDRSADQHAKLMPAGSAVVLPGLGHVGAFDRSDLAVPRFREFLQRAGRVRR